MEVRNAFSRARLEQQDKPLTAEIQPTSKWLEKQLPLKRIYASGKQRSVLRSALLCRKIMFFGEGQGYSYVTEVGRLQDHLKKEEEIRIASIKWQQRCDGNATDALLRKT